MPSINLNKSVWNDQNQWADSGDKWSLPWGCTEAQWYFTILPRILRWSNLTGHETLCKMR